MIHPLHESPTVDAIPTQDSSFPLVSNISPVRTIVYELQASRPLSSIDCARSVKLVLLPEPWLIRMNTFLRVMRLPLRVAFAVGLALICSAPLFGKLISSCLAVSGSALAIVPMVASYLHLRFDMIMLLATTFEFWYFTAVSLSATVFLAVNYGDLRYTAIFCDHLMYQISLMTDANVRGVNTTITASLFGAIVLIGFVVMQRLELLTDYSKVVIVSYGTWSLESSDVIANGFVNLTLIMVRNAYRKWTTLVKRDRENVRVCCISYRVSLRYTECLAGQSGGSVCSTSPISKALPEVPVSLTTLDSPAISQLKLSPLGFQIYADALMIQWRQVLPVKLTQLTQRISNAMGIVGGASTVLTLPLYDGHQQHQHHKDLVLAFISATFSTCFVLRCAAFFNRRLLRHILWSFDFLFLSLQTSIAHVVLGYLLRWNTAKCLVLWASWCWMHWVMTLDLLTPVVRRRLGLHKCRSGAIAVLVLQSIAHIVVVVELLFVRKWMIDDRPFFMTHVTGKNVVIFAMPVLLTRMVTTFCWCLRLLRRLWIQSENELIMIQGAVEYEDYDRLRRLRGASRRMSAGPKQESSSFLALPSRAR